MIDVKEIIKKDVSRKQRGLKLRVGDFFMRGIEPVEIVSKDGSKIGFASLITGKKDSVTHREFTSYALSRIKYTGKMSTDYLKMVWGFAGAKGTPARSRARIVRGLIKDAPNDKDAQKVRSWVFALSNDMEPKK